ncbi:hypothetical protein R1flu_026911 [Riccia fluitans]|uniref:Lipoxygenase n=1 Tax=Riccia fluitans TaxID=41844 RepID=A0ABD1XLD5_9MARC
MSGRKKSTGENGGPNKPLVGGLSDLVRCAGGGGSGDERDGGGSASGVRHITGTVVILKKYVLDLVDTASSLVDTTLDLLGYKVEFQLVSVDLDPETNAPKLSRKTKISNWATQGNVGGSVIASEDFVYKIRFKVADDFGEPGAVLVRNNHRTHFFLQSITLEYPPTATAAAGVETSSSIIKFPCNSWIYNTYYYTKDRVFFSNKVHLPGATPPGLKALREQELELLRGDGTGERQYWDRIYDYDVYNDLGNVDNPRPVLGTMKFPYPRRCRTGRAKSEADPSSEMSIEEGTSLMYVPRDERFTRVKNSGFLASGVKSVVHFIIPALTSIFDGTPNEFDSMEDVKSLYINGVDLHGYVNENKPDYRTNSKLPQENPYVLLQTIFSADGSDKSLLRFPLPQLLTVDDTAWLSDEEYGRQTLSGINPCVIRALEVFPPISSLDPSVYGRATALQENHILPNLEGLTVTEALKQKRLFTIDYHDIYMPYLERINLAKDGGKAYAPRSIFFYTKEGTMKPIAIELSVPPHSGSTSAIRRIFLPPAAGSTEKDYCWELAKIHANSIDFGYHELVTHWLRSHAVMEPIIIASNRQLSRMHPLFNLLLPCFKNTLNINAIAWQSLINATGIIEDNFSPGKCSMEMSAVTFQATWRFDTQALPQDLISRGMAVPADDSYPGGVKLVVEDYPFAKDGLELWDGIKMWIAKYVSIMYKDSDELIQADTELQSWWKELVNVGFADMKSAPWWPKPNSCKSLVEILTTISWIAGPHHAAVNFGQYAYAGFMPNKPSMTRKFIPEKNSPEYAQLLSNPEKYFLSTTNTQLSATIVMAVIELLSTHAVDEEYQGYRNSDMWTSDEQVKAAFADFTNSMNNLEKKISERNRDPSLKNRHGTTNIPYTLLFPTSTSGLTGQGVPYSTSI